MNHNPTKGFTLIELLVVIAIIALLSSVVLASLSTARLKARDANRIASLTQVQKALEMYYDSKGYYPPVRTTSDQYMCPANTDCWDKNSWILSFTPDWQTSLGAALAPYLSKMPVDPINSNCWVFDTAKTCYSFAYGCVGKDQNPHTYDLVAMLETPNHSLSCKFQKSRWGVGYATMLGYTTGFAICTESGAPYASATYSSSIFHLP